MSWKESIENILERERERERESDCVRYDPGSYNRGRVVEGG